MADNLGKDSSVKVFSKNVLKGALYSSPFDPDMTEKKAALTPEFTTKQVFHHLTGKEKLSDQEIEELKRASKYNRFI